MSILNLSINIEMNFGQRSVENPITSTKQWALKHSGYHSLVVHVTCRVLSPRSAVPKMWATKLSGTTGSYQSYIDGAFRSRLNQEKTLKTERHKK